MSDFPKAVARIHKGFCPVCNAKLERREAWAYCDECDVGWALDTPIARQTLGDPDDPNGSTPQISVSRRLRPEEVRKLYDRGEEQPPKRKRRKTST